MNIESAKKVLDLFADDIYEGNDNLHIKHLLITFATYFSTYNNIVSKSGHNGYFMNGYHSDNTYSDNSISNDMTNVKDFIKNINTLNIHLDSNNLNKLCLIIENVLSNISFETEQYTKEDCDFCKGEGFYEAEDENDEEYDKDCEDCNGTGEVECENPRIGGFTEECENYLDSIDQKLYDISDNVIIDFSTYIYKKRLHPELKYIFPELLVKDKLNKF
jgi:hypothetical protein